MSLFRSFCHHCLYVQIIVPPLSVFRLLYEEDPINFWMCKIWWCHQKKKLYIHLEYNVSIVMTHTKNYVPVGQTCCRWQRQGWRLSQQCRNAFTERFLCSDVLRLSSGEVFPAVLRKFFKLLWRPLSITIYSSQVATFEDTDHCGQLVTIATIQSVAKVKYLLKEDPWITQNEIKDMGS